MRSSLVAGIAVWCVSGCSSPREHLYYLEPAAGETAKAPAGAPVVVVGPISIPELLDRPLIVVRASEFEVLINEQQRWAEPLKVSLTDLLVAELAQRVPGTRFVPSSSTAGSVLERRLSVDIRTLILDRRQGAEISAYWVYRDSTATGPSREGESRVHAELRHPGYAGLVDALGNASRMLAGDIAISLREPPSER